MSKIKKLLNLAIIVIYTLGCEKQYSPNDGYISESFTLEAKEDKKTYFFHTNADFGLSSDTIDKINKLLSKSRQEGISNVGFMLIANNSVSHELQQHLKKQIYSLLHKNGFINTRIIDSGICTYKNAKTGIRIDILEYKIKTPNCDVWTEYIGDTDTNKHLPKYGASGIYNLEEMIANKADLVAPREYPGQEVTSAISSFSSTTGAESSGTGAGTSSSGESE